MSWFSILPPYLTLLETWIIRLFLLLALLTVAPWAILIAYDILLYILRSIAYITPFVGGRAKGKRRPRRPTIGERIAERGEEVGRGVGEAVGGMGEGLRRVVSWGSGGDGEGKIEEDSRNAEGGMDVDAGGEEKEGMERADGEGVGWYKNEEETESVEGMRRRREVGGRDEG